MAVPSKPAPRRKLKHFLRALCSIFAAVAGLFFLFGGGIIHAVTGLDRLLAEILAIAIALVCLIGIVIAKHLIDDIEWKETNEEAALSEMKPNS